jgi:hypothetical protein
MRQRILVCCRDHTRIDSNRAAAAQALALRIVAGRLSVYLYSPCHGNPPVRADYSGTIDPLSRLAGIEIPLGGMGNFIAEAPLLYLPVSGRF